MPTGRFAPSPSGRMHLGNAFSALLAWLSIRSQGGTIVLRIEDLDPARCRPAYITQLREDLRWLGLDWDTEAPLQSQRTAAYAAAFAALEDRVYPCYCSRGELLAASAPHLSDGRSVYPGTCRDLTPAQQAAKTKPPCWRLRVPDETITVQDGLQGCYRENLARETGDFIVRRADGVYAYQLAVVVDDLAAGVTEAVRGCDLLSSTPRQVYLYRLLGAAPPRYWHVPLLMAEDGRRLSKRERDLDLGALAQRMRPEQVVGALAHWAGLRPTDAAVPAAELVREFDWSRVRRENVTVPAEWEAGK